MSDFADWQADYEALTTRCGVIQLADWSQVQVSGRDAASFLHNMCTNDIRRLEPGQSCEAFFTDVKGKILAHTLVIATGEHVEFLAVPDQAERLITHLDRYIIREDVQLADVTNDFAWYYALGPQSGEINAENYELIVHSDFLWPGGFLVRVQSGDSNPFAALPTIDTTSPAWAALRVESQLPLFGTDFGESHLPQEINRDKLAINFNKGCYLGQETIARIDALGHVNKLLVLVQFFGEQIPTVGSKLTKDGQEVGTITTSSWSPQLVAPAAIALVRRGANELGTEIQSDTGDAKIVQAITASA
jgi:folate-binding protein YgfZ